MLCYHTKVITAKVLFKYIIVRKHRYVKNFSQINCKIGKINDRLELCNIFLNSILNIYSYTGRKID